MRPVAAAALAVLVNALGFAQGARLDPNLVPYKPAAGVAGAVTVMGSDSLDTVVQAWFSGFRKFHPDVALKSTAVGSADGHLALLEGTSLIGSMSREMTKPEIAAFEAKYGYAPTRLVVGLDALVIFVHPGNHISGLTFEQLDAIYSTTRKQGGKDPITTWAAAGVPEMGTRKINLYGRDESSGTRGFFKEKIMLKGDSRPGVTRVSEASALLEAVSLDGGGIGYASLGEINSLVRVLPVGVGTGPKVLPTTDSVLKGDYPLTRFLYLYVNRAPGKPLPTAVLAFLSFAFSRDGQAAMAASHIPIPADLCRNMLAKVQ